ncbi:hypothetical protein PENTCL1PPCAC_29779, partial [Pristionchus entomophagus]
MLPLPLTLTISFFIELICCSLYLAFIIFLAFRKEPSLSTPFLKLFCSTGLAGIGTVVTYWMVNFMLNLPVTRDTEWLIRVSQTTNGAAIYSFTVGTFIIVLNRLAVLNNITSSINIWSTRKTLFLIGCQFILPLMPHLYFVFGYVNWIDDTYTGWDNTTGSVSYGSIYRGLTGFVYVIFAISGVALNILAVYRLKKLVLSAQNRTTISRDLAIYTLTSTAFHLLFAFHQFIWSYAFLSGNRDMLTIVRAVRYIIHDLTIFADPIVMVSLSRPVRNVYRRWIFGS